MKKRPFGLIAIVLYKSLIAGLLIVTSIALFFAMKNYEALQNFSENYQIAGKSALINWVLDKILNINPKKLEFSAIGAASYAAITLVEAIGLWYEKQWAHVLVLFLVGISIPPEIYELLKGISPLKLIVFGINLVVFWYLVKHFPRHSR